MLPRSTLRALLKSEVETRAPSNSLDNYIRAPDVERVRIERDLEYIDGVTRQLTIAAKSLGYGPREAARTTGVAPKPIEEHWLDIIMILRQRNEDGELLARAFAQEAAEPAGRLALGHFDR